MKLTDSHLVLLSAAAQHDARLMPRPDRLTGKATRSLVIRLIRAGLVEEVPVRHDQPHWNADDDARPVGLRITDAGLAAIGLDAADEAGAPASIEDTGSRPARAPRAGSKQAVVLDLLTREEGATLDDLMAATGWLPHTTRAALTGFRKKAYAVARGRTGRAGPSTASTRLARRRF